MEPGRPVLGEEGEAIDEWAKPIIARGPRPEFTMEQVLPGADNEDPFSDPIGESNAFKDAGDLDRRLQDTDGSLPHRSSLSGCSFAFGKLAFERCPKDAIRHYEADLGL